MSRSNKKKKQKNKINEPAVKIQTERDIPPKSSLEADEDIAGMASAAGILSDISSETKRKLPRALRAVAGQGLISASLTTTLKRLSTTP